MKKTYPRLRLQKRQGVWHIHLLHNEKSVPSDKNEVGWYTYQFDARNKASQLCGRPVILKMVLNKP